MWKVVWGVGDQGWNQEVGDRKRAGNEDVGRQCQGPVKPRRNEMWAWVTELCRGECWSGGDYRGRGADSLKGTFFVKWTKFEKNQVISLDFSIVYS